MKTGWFHWLKICGLKIEKVHLKLKLQGTDTSKVKGLVSVACIQDNRLELKKLNDIESYFYLKHDLGDLPLKENYLGNTNADKNYLENVLLVKGWRNYTWPELLEAKGKDTIGITSSPVFAGQVSNGNKLIKKPKFVVIVSDSLSHIINTTAEGNFEITNNYLIAEQDKKVRFMINSTSSDSYELNLTDPYTAIHNTLAQHYNPQNFELAAYTQNTETVNMKGFERAIRLKGVTILAHKDNSLYKSNACGDYVCRFRVLNCPNHRFEADTRPAVKDETYYVNGIAELYLGCRSSEKKFNSAMPGIYRAPEVLAGMEWNSKIDIWSIGVMVRFASLSLISSRLCLWLY
ncbi:MAG: hypothetical protein EOP45_10415 [Sphingobacteriaceae bacterium]|nr:MAG: hypothetical protein EOP45_10415 [Sphingobacteriaceae bacterium]